MPAASNLLGSTGSTTFVLAAILVACGLAMLGACLWLVRATRTDTPALGPLEVMGDRRFARRDAEARRAALAAARPEGAEAPAPMVPIDDEEPAVEEVAVEEPAVEQVAVEEPAVEGTVTTDPTAPDKDSDKDSDKVTDPDDSVEATSSAD